MTGQWKGLQDYLNEDQVLTTKITYQDYVDKKSSPVNSDCSITDAFDSYKRLMERVNSGK